MLAPSRSAADVLAANGVARDRLDVDENGMDVPATRSRPRRRAADGQPVVVRYTGGSNPMKGADVLLDAAHQLGAAPGLRIVAHDLDDAVRARRSIRSTAPSLELVPAYAPEELDDVLAATDVLVLPVGDARVALARHPRGAAAAACR